ncbi:MAG: hypothetical protein ACRC4G_01205 [Alphaproteobacteria bacterium]
MKPIQWDSIFALSFLGGLLSFSSSGLAHLTSELTFDAAKETLAEKPALAGEAFQCISIRVTHENEKNVFSFLKAHQGSFQNFSLRLELFQGLNLDFLVYLTGVVRELHISPCQWTPEAIKTVNRCLCQLSAGLKVLNLSKTGLTSEVFKKIFASCHAFHKLENLDLSHNHLEPKFSHFFVELSKNQFEKLKKFNLSYNSLGKNSVEILGKSLSLIPITELNVSYNQFSPETFLKFAPHLPQSLKKLNLEGNSLGTAGAQILSAYLPPELKSLYLGFTGLDDSALSWVIHHLPKSLKKLCIRGNILGKLASRGLSAYIQKTPLAFLNLAKMDIASKRYYRLIPALCGLTASLKHLDLSHNTLTPFFIKMLNLSNFKKLQILQLNKNFLGDEGLKILLENQLPSSLKYLALSDNAIGCSGITALKRYLRKHAENLNLLYLDLKRNESVNQEFQPTLHAAIPSQLEDLLSGECFAYSKRTSSLVIQFLRRLSLCAEKGRCCGALAHLTVSRKTVSRPNSNPVFEKIKLQFCNLDIKPDRLSSFSKNLLDILPFRGSLSFVSKKCVVWGNVSWEFKH